MRRVRTGSVADMKTPREVRTIGPIRTIPNVITVVRTLAAVFIAAYALTIDDPKWWIVTGYAIYWIGDSLDGLAARVLDQETRAGAVFDILSDRISTALLAGGLIHLQPDLWPAITIFLLNFMVLDCMLSLSFLLWPIASPNYFASIDPLVFKLNWSHPAKALNNVGIVVAILVGSLPIALVIVLAQISVKVWSARVVLERVREKDYAG
ncbi:hypothetical protein BH09ACT10_BH09ACT10_18040 [soil metagenome]